MKIIKKTPPRKFLASKKSKIVISDCGQIHLKPNEQVTFITAAGKKHDFTAKSWGFYATPSVNGRLLEEGFKTALVKNRFGQYYIMVIDRTKLTNFKAYLKSEKNEVVEWLNKL